MGLVVSTSTLRKNAGREVGKGCIGCPTYEWGQSVEQRRVWFLDEQTMICDMCHGQCEGVKGEIKSLLYVSGEMRDEGEVILQFSELEHWEFAARGDRPRKLTD